MQNNFLAAKDDRVRIYSNRIESNISDLQQVYFGWRLKGYQMDQDQPLKGELPKNHDSFSSALVKSSQYSQFKTLATLTYADNLFNYSSSIVSSIDFDKDDEFFATAGVTKKIKIYSYESVVSTKNTRQKLEEGYSIQTQKYPLREMSCQSKVSCLSYNPYIKSYILSSDYEGVIRLWDTTVGSSILNFDEHEKRS